MREEDDHGRSNDVSVMLKDFACIHMQMSVS